MTQLGQKLVDRGMRQGLERGLEQGLERGLEQGLERGLAQGKLEIARNLIGLLDDQTIAERTGLPLETVLELKEKKESVLMV